ncbi:ABC transporter permease [Deinococcus cellulosilyticus]|uniref:ABC transporter permease n=1 Tax=Deinococcus cellulosilyticus (strain DSM 18568 / NBRC 106333 / KACC 11606 / 5516J-15) TaxID=1223518 RepID=A0A511MXG6_DEIC1|nr:ABC transporter permease [Deinococcus cellulosilyticus]GEM45284.1 ABC transporter permease [Deinococcus cellulosilyticus NBRC 106333 = KACC 11606]
MRINDAIKLALRPIRTRKLESILIILALALGVGVVTLAISMIQTVTAFSMNMDSRNMRELTVVSKKDDWGAFSEGGHQRGIVELGGTRDKAVKLDLKDLEVILKGVPALQYGYVLERQSTKEPGQKNAVWGKEFGVTAATEQFSQADGLKLVQGSWISQKEYMERKPVIMLTDWAAKQRFPGENPVGKTLRLGDYHARDFKVVGVFQPEKDNNDYLSNTTAGWGSIGLVPLNSTWSSQVTQLSFLPRAGTDLAQVQATLRAFVQQQYGPSVVVRSQKDRMLDWRKSAMQSGLLLAAFASAGLIVAAINITNLMLARVLGRTRQFGIASALGADRGLTLRLVLLESLVLGALGGLLGIGLAYGFEKVLKQAMGNATPTGMLTPLTCAEGFGVALLVSVIFGLYPAMVASRLRPIEALKTA